MRSATMDVPLLVSSVLRHAARYHGETEIVSQTVEGSFRRTTCAETWWRSAPLVGAKLMLPGPKYDGASARWRVPDGVRYATEFPHTATGKLLKTKIRELYAGSPPNEAA